MGHHHHHAAPASATASAESASPESRERYRATFKVTIIGSVIDFSLAVAKIIAGVMAHSQSLIADGVHSLSDLGTDVIVIYAAKHAHREADEEHPYGHGRIETVATVVLGTVLAAVGIGIIWDATYRLFHPDLLLNPTMAAIVIAAISVVSKEAIYHYTMHYAKKYRSKMLRANAWHSRTDAISSVVVIIGVAGTMAGLAYLDAIAAIIVGLMIAKIGWDLAWHAVQELIDTGLEKEMVEKIQQTIMDVDGVKNMHMLRTRRMGGEALADVHILVSPRISVSEGHQIGETVRGTLIETFDEISDVTVHIDPEDDEAGPRCDGLPLRGAMLKRLREAWSHIPEAAHLENVSLHYLQGRIHLELFLPLNALDNPDQAHETTRALVAASKTVSEIGEVVVHYR
jgi:cation diffusion facilitator family transporter